MSTPLGRARSYRRNRGQSILETLFAMGLVLTLLSGMLSLTSLISRANTRAQAESPMAFQSRTSIDEVNYDLRAANQVVPSYSSYSTSASSCVVKAQAFNLSQSNPAISGSYDYISLAYDSSSQQLLESIVPGSGSTRTARTNFVLAKNVSGVQFSYYARSQATASSASCTLALSGTPTATPTVYVNGTQTISFSYTTGTAQATVTGLTSGDDVQAVYPVSPSANGGADLSYATEVDTQIVQSQTDGLGVSRTITLQAGTRLRNQRI